MAMGGRLFRSGRFLSDRFQAVAFVKADAQRPLLGLGHVPAFAWSRLCDAMKLTASLISEPNLELLFSVHCRALKKFSEIES